MDNIIPTAREARIMQIVIMMEKTWVMGCRARFVLVFVVCVVCGDFFFVEIGDADREAIRKGIRVDESCRWCLNGYVWCVWHVLLLEWWELLD